MNTIQKPTMGLTLDSQADGTIFISWSMPEHGMTWREKIYLVCVHNWCWLILNNM